MVKCSPRLLNRTFAALADPTRRRILEHLAAGDRCVTDLARPYSMSLPAVSKHLRVLEKAGLIRRRRHGRVHQLKLEAAPMQQAQQWIEEYRRFWEESFDRLDEYLKELQTKEKKMTTKNNRKAAPDSTGQEFIITREFAAPRELVFKAWTNPEQLAQWWGPRGFTNPLCEWDPRPGKKIHVVMRAPNGTNYPMGGEFREIAAPERLVFTTGALDDAGKMLFEILHTLTLVEQKGKTKLTLHSQVINATPGAEKYIGGFDAGMTQSLEKLAELLMATHEPLVLERTFAAPVAQVWQALTQVDNIRRWFFDLQEFKPEVGFTFEFTVVHEGFTYNHHCKVTEVIPQKRLAYTWRYQGHEGDSLVTFELMAAGEQTRLKLTHEGLETFPKAPPFARKNFLQAWTALIGSSLKDYVENADREIVVSREFAAPRELVWEAMTNPKHLVNWWGPRGFTTTIEVMDFRVGGEWKQVMHGPDGANYPNAHVFQEIVKPERIVFAQHGKREGGPSINFVATWTFDAVESSKTRVTICMLFPTATERDFVVKELGAIVGAKQTLERLGEQLEKMAAPAAR